MWLQDCEREGVGKGEERLVGDVHLTRSEWEGCAGFRFIAVRVQNSINRGGRETICAWPLRKTAHEINS